jgi:hypothetical protein
MSTFKNLLVWLKENERHLWSAVFVGGFLTDLVTFLPAPLAQANSLFGIYLAIVLFSTLGSHYLYVNGYDQKKGLGGRILNVGFPLVAEFFIGALLSGFLIFYSKSSSILVSWPFLLLLAAIFFGNELFRDYRKHLAFMAGLIFFSIYAYTIFSLPLAVHKISATVFLESGAISVVAFTVFLTALGYLGWKRLKESLLLIAVGTIGLIVLVNISYFTGILPPLPLTLTDVGEYQTITHDSSGYILTGEAKKPWWDVMHPKTVHLVPGAPLSVYSSVFAPVAFSSTIVHRWELYDTSKHTWVPKAQIAFLIGGGRSRGYRGYSTLSNVVPGQYRVSVETLTGQVIGRDTFTVVFVRDIPPLITETR